MSERDHIGVVCPFCGEDDFDLIGLKMHLQRSCDVFDGLDGRTQLEHALAEPAKRQEPS